MYARSWSADVGTGYLRSSSLVPEFFLRMKWGSPNVYQLSSLLLISNPPHQIIPHSNIPPSSWRASLTCWVVRLLVYGFHRMYIPHTSPTLVKVQVEKRFTICLQLHTTHLASHHTRILNLRWATAAHGMSEFCSRGAQWSHFRVVISSAPTPS